MRSNRAGEDSFSELGFEITKTADERFALTVNAAAVTTPSSEASGFYPPLTPRETEVALSTVPNAPDEFQRSSAGTMPRDSIKKLGEVLFASLFEGRTGKLYQQSLEMAAATSHGVRIRLTLHDAELEALPWEYLYDANRGDFVALSVNSPLLRTRGKLQSVSPVTAPLRILIVKSDWALMDADEEVRRIEALKTKGAVFETLVLNQPSRGEFLDAIRHENFHVLHIIANGQVEHRPNKQAASYIASALRIVSGSHHESSDAIIDVKQLRYLCADKADLRLICLSGDFTDQMASELARVCPAVIGWRGENSNGAYLSFSDGLYSSLLLGHPLEAALTQARQRVDLDRPGGKEWGMPVCYLQAEHGAFFQNSRRTSTRGLRSIDPVLEQQDALKDSANARLWKKLHALIEIEQHNLAAIEDQTATYPDAVPAILEEQRKSTLARIAQLESELKQLT
jgi:hypothetical protein